MDRDALFKELNMETRWYSEHTRRQYFSHVSDYLDYVDSVGGDWKDRDILDRYTQKLKQKGKSQVYINYIVRGPIGCLFRAHGLRMPLKLPRVTMARFDFAARLQFSAEEVQLMIQAALKSGNPVWQFIMAVSTIYGPRASEIRAIRQEDIHPKKMTLVIHVLKYGVKREHVVPPAIQPYIFGNPCPMLSSNGLYEVIHEVAKVAGMPYLPRKAYHAVRHCLATELRYTSEFDDPLIAAFMGWAEGGMVPQYATPFLPKVDGKIFAKHPFLEFWL